MINRYLLLYAAVLHLCFAALARADEPSITVAGTGEVVARPDRLEVEVRATGAAELTSDAAVKFQDAVRRVRNGLARSGIKDLKIEDRNLRISSGMEDEGDEVVFVGQPQANAQVKADVRISRLLRVVVSGIDKMPEADVIATVSKLIDAAKDAGATVGRQGGSYGPYAVAGNSTVVRFLVEHPDDLREQAYRKAFENATMRATRLAKLAHGRLGRAISIDEQGATMMQVYQVQEEVDEDARLASDELADIPIRVALRVRFELVDVQPRQPTGGPEK